MTGIADHIRRHHRERPDAVALVFEGCESSYRALDENASRVANALIAEGLVPGDRIAYLGKNRDIYFEYWIGAIKAGCVTVPVNWRLAPPEVAYILNDCRPRIILCEPEFLDRLTNITARVLVTEAADGSTGYTEWRDSASPVDPMRDVGYDDAVLQLYTSGTTGHPKGAMLSNRSLLGQRASVEADALPEWYRWSEDDVSLIAMPIFHISGSGWGLWTLQHGAKGIVVREFNPDRVLDLLVRYQITKIILVPTALRILCDHPDAATTDFSFLKYICYGGSAIPPELLRQAMQVIGCGFAQMYGMTETAGTIIGLPPEDHDVAGGQRMTGVGIPLPGVRVRIADENGGPVASGEVGEILIASQSNMIGYFEKPEATAETIDADGWLRTGDAGWMDEDGYLYLADRIRDMIITGGENVYPAEVENALYSHPAVADVAVIGVADPKWGQAVMAVVVPTAGATPDSADLIRWARERVAAYKAPKSIMFRDELPRNPSGKVLRRLLREEYS